MGSVRPVDRPCYLNPRWFLDDDPASPTRTLVINMVEITSSDQLAKTGMGTVQMKVSELYPTQDITLSPSETITITFPGLTEGYTTAWQNYFSDSQVFTTTPSLYHPIPAR